MKRLISSLLLISCLAAALPALALVSSRGHAAGVGPSAGVQFHVPCTFGGTK